MRGKEKARRVTAFLGGRLMYRLVRYSDSVDALIRLVRYPFAYADYEQERKVVARQMLDNPYKLFSIRVERISFQAACENNARRNCGQRLPHIP